MHKLRFSLIPASKFQAQVEQTGLLHLQISELYFVTLAHAEHAAVLVLLLQELGMLGSVVLVVLTQILGIALAAILTGVVATAYTTQVERRVVMYEMEIREALADGVVTEEERLKLDELKDKLGMSDEQVEAIARQVREEKGLA